MIKDAMQNNWYIVASYSNFNRSDWIEYFQMRFFNSTNKRVINN